MALRQLPQVNFRWCVYEAGKVTAPRAKILLEDLMDALQPIVESGSVEQINDVHAPVGAWALEIMRRGAREAILARDAMARVDPAAEGIMRDGGIYFGSIHGHFVYRAGKLEPLKGG